MIIILISGEMLFIISITLGIEFMRKKSSKKPCKTSQIKAKEDLDTLRDILWFWIEDSIVKIDFPPKLINAVLE